MKKLILLLILPLTTMIATDFIMTEEGLFANTTTESTNPDIPVETPLSESNNPYLETIDLPKCDKDNPEVQFIQSNSDWSTINSSKRIFCVSPGDYTSLGNIKLTASGTADKRRYIILNNGNDTHPGKLNKSQLANFALNLRAANYWVVDRAASFNVDITHSFILNKNSTHNIFNRLFTQNIFHTMWVRDKAHYNTIQNGRFDGITMTGAKADLATINLMEYTLDNFSILETKVINNEFINVKAFRLNRYPEEHRADKVHQYANFDGSVFYGNTIEFNTDIRTDCAGNFIPDGECISGEAGAVGIKSGSNNPSNPIIISNNHMWGYRAADLSYENLSNPGSFLTAYMGAKNIKIINNVIFDGTNGIVIADRYDMSRGTWDAEIIDNIIVGCGPLPNAKKATAMNISQAEGANVYNNLIKDARGPWLQVQYNMYNNTVGNNVGINVGEPMVYIGNWETVNGIKTNTQYNTPEEAGYIYDYTFTTDKFTNSPRNITLKNVLKSR